MMFQGGNRRGVSAAQSLFLLFVAIFVLADSASAAIPVRISAPGNEALIKSSRFKLEIRTGTGVSRPRVEIAGKNVSGKEYSDKVGGQDMKHYVITAEITDMFKYMEQQSKNSNETMNITVKKLENGNFSFTQNLAMGDNSGLPTSGVDAKSLQSFLKDMYWTVVVHVPSVVSADKTAKVSGGTVEWAIPIGDVMAATKPIELKLEYSPKGGGDFPTWIIFVIVGVVVVALIVVGVLLFLRRRKPAPAVDYSAYGYPPYIDPNAPPQPPAEGQPPYPPQAPGGQQ